MNSFPELGQELSSVVTEAMRALENAGRSENVAHKPSPTRWSKKEILGHLVDSASNNHQRFVRAALEGTLTFPGYEQEGWARIQRHGDAEWSQLLVLWSTYNLRLATVIEGLPASAASVPCRIGSAEPVTLSWLVEDYIRHMRHHLRQLIPNTMSASPSTP